VTQAHRLRWALALNALIVVSQVVAGIMASSIGLISDAGHNLADVAAVALALFAVRTAQRSATSRRSFGFHRAPILAAQANAAGVLVVTGLLTLEALRRLLDPSPVKGGVVLVVALVAMAANLLAARLTGGHAHQDLNMRSAHLHLIGDAATSAGAAAAGAVILATGGAYWLDPAVSIAIGALIAARAISLLREANDVLLEAVPSHIELHDVHATITSVPGVAAVHDLHAWSLSSDLAALSAHVVLNGQPSLADAQAVTNLIKTQLASAHGITHATLEMEVDDCTDPNVDPCSVSDPTRTTLNVPHGHSHGH
jgi:cobalt-zinc-cadmium efflux system protein